MQLKILSWNIWFHGNLEKVNDFLEKSNADIIGLQEVMMIDHEMQISPLLTNKLGYKYVYAATFQYPIKGALTDIGNAILSKYPIMKSEVHNLSEKENRVAVQADIKVGNNVIHAFCTHLIHTHQKPSEIQDLQATNLVKVISPEKTILMGDFNCLPDSNAIKIISKSLKNTDTNSLPTWSVYPQGCKVCLPKGIIYKLDNIFTTKDVKSSSYKVGTSQASDHLPISVVIEA